MRNVPEGDAGFWTDVRKADAAHLRGRRSTLKWVRAAKSRDPLAGFVVTWDVDSRDRAQCARLQRFIYGARVTRDGKAYEYAGIVERDGVRYLGQSVLIVRKDTLPELVAGLTEIGLDFEID